MSGAQDFWRVRLASAAEADFDQIVQWTARRFGKDQADVYAKTLLAALDDLKQGPDAAGIRIRDDLSEGIFTLHAARSGRRARHLIVFRVEPDRGGKIMQVLRILHDAMDLPRHLPSPPSPGDEG